MGIRKQHRIGRRQAGEAVGAARQLACILAEADAVLGHRLIEAGDRTAAAMAVEDDPANPRQPAEIREPGLHLERDGLPPGRVLALDQAQGDEAAPGHLDAHRLAGAVAILVEDRDMRRGARRRPGQHAVNAAKPDELGHRFGPGRRGGEQGQGEDGPRC